MAWMTATRKLCNWTTTLAALLATTWATPWATALVRSLYTRRSCSCHRRSRRIGPLCHLQAPSYCAKLVRLECYQRWSATSTVHWCPTRSVCTRRSGCCHRRHRRKWPLCHLQVPSCCEHIVRLECLLGWSATLRMPWSQTPSECTRRSSSCHRRHRRKGPLYHLQAPSCCEDILRLEYLLGWSATSKMPWCSTRSMSNRRWSSRNRRRGRRIGPLCHLRAWSYCDNIFRLECHPHCPIPPNSLTFLTCTTIK